MNLLPPRITTRTPEQVEATNADPRTQMLVAIGATGRHMYLGTVPGHVKARRRAANKAARRARRVTR